MDIARYLLNPSTTPADVRNMIMYHMDSCEDNDGQLWLTADKITADQIWVE